MLLISLLLSVNTHEYHAVSVEVRGQLVGIGSIFPLCGLSGIKLRSSDSEASSHWANSLAHKLDISDTRRKHYFPIDRNILP